MTCAFTRVLVEQTPTNSNLESCEAPKGVEIRDNDSQENLEFLGQRQVLVCGRICFNKASGGSSWFPFWMLSGQTHRRALSELFSISNWNQVPPPIPHPRTGCYKADPAGLFLPPTGTCT